MEEQIVSWREQAVGLGRVGRGRRYPPEMRAQAVQMCRAFEACGETTDAFAKKLGVPLSTLRTWVSREAPEALPRGSLVPVTLIAEPVVSSVRLQLGSAHADVSVAQLAELVRRLS